MTLCIPFFLLRGNVEEMGDPRGLNLNLGCLITGPGRQRFQKTDARGLTPLIDY